MNKQSSLWSALVYSTVHGRMIASRPGSASVGLWVFKRLCWRRNLFTLSFLLIHTYLYSYTVCDCVLERESCHEVSRSMDWFDPPPYSQIKVCESHWQGSFNDLTRSTYFHLPVFSINNSMCTATESYCSCHKLLKIDNLSSKRQLAAAEPKQDSPRHTRAHTDTKTWRGSFHHDTQQCNS